MRVMMTISSTDNNNANLYKDKNIRVLFYNIPMSYIRKAKTVFPKTSGDASGITTAAPCLMDVVVDVVEIPSQYQY